MNGRSWTSTAPRSVLFWQNRGKIMQKIVRVCMCAKKESVHFRYWPAQNRNSYFAVPFRNCTGTIRELRKGFDKIIERLNASAQSENLSDKVRIKLQFTVIPGIFNVIYLLKRLKLTGVYLRSFWRILNHILMIIPTMIIKVKRSLLRDSFTAFISP